MAQNADQDARRVAVTETIANFKNNVALLGLEIISKRDEISGLQRQQAELEGRRTMMIKALGVLEDIRVELEQAPSLTK